MPARVIDHKTRKLLRAGWLIAFLIAAWALFSPWGAIKYFRISNDLAQLEAANQELQENNRQIGEEVERLTSDTVYIEDVAREQYGLLKTNEFVYVFPGRKKSKP